MRNRAKVPNNAEPKLTFIIQTTSIQLTAPRLDQCVRATALDDRDIFTLELNIGIKVRLEFSMLVVAALTILIAAKADQIIHVCPLANGN